jgi:hypothetical protein
MRLEASCWYRWLGIPAVALVLSACGSHSASDPSGTGTDASRPAPTTLSTSPAPRSTPSNTASFNTVQSNKAPSTTVVPATTTTDPGLLPQTSVEPPTDATSLAERLQPLWAAVSGSAPPDAPAGDGHGIFFPESAYVQLKTGLLASPAGDYASRLLAFYDLDLAATRSLVTEHASTPSPAPQSFVGIAVDPSMAAWIPPGACENRFGYWHLPGIRVLSASDGAERSFGIASLISWRGEWFVVHLGPNPRPSNVGTVYAPATGAGTPGPAGGC